MGISFLEWPLSINLPAKIPDRAEHIRAMENPTDSFSIPHSKVVSHLNSAAGKI